MDPYLCLLVKREQEHGRLRRPTYCPSNFVGVSFWKFALQRFIVRYSVWKGRL